MLACDACGQGHHQSCIGLRVVPPGEWFGPCCRAWVAARKRSRPDPRPQPERVPPTYAVAGPPRLDKSKRREAAGLGRGGLPTAEDVRRLKAEAVAPATRKKIETVQRLFLGMAAALGIAASSEGAYDLFVTWRVKEGKSINTILSDMSLLKQVEGVRVPPEKEVRRLSQAVRRLAECPGHAKDPITLGEMQLLRRELLAGWRDDGSEQNVRKLRNWTFFLLGFIGMFRGGELANLRWDSVRLGWRTTAAVVELSVDAQPPARSQLEFATLHVVESKTDPAAQGQLVRVAAGAHHDLFHCPLQLLLKLHKRRRSSGFVFEETRMRCDPQGLSDGTFLTLLHETLRAAGVSEERNARLGLHSLRRGGATAAAAGGATIREIKTHGRWRSDVAYIYALVSDQQVSGLTKELLSQLRDMARGE